MSRNRFEINLSPSRTRVVFEFHLDLFGEVGKQHDAKTIRSDEVVGASRRVYLQHGGVGLGGCQSRPDHL